MRSGAVLRPEYEAPCRSLADGVEMLAQAGAPEEIVALVRACPLQETARACFRRTVWQIAAAHVTAELCLDLGRLCAGGREEPLCEMELEYQSGAQDAFLRWGAQLERQLGLARQERSKYARLMALRRRNGKE